MYIVSEKFKADLKSLMGEDTFSNEEYAKGMEAFEHLINIDDGISNFNADYGKKLNERKLLDDSWDVYTGCRVEGLLKKIEHLKGNNIEGVMLNGFYTRLGFFDWLNDSEVIEARKKDAANSANADNSKHGKGYGFHLEDADASAYAGCPHFMKAYIVAYQLRNRTKAHDNKDDADYLKKMDKIKSLFIVYLDQCIKNYDLICEAYVSDSIRNKIDFKTYAKDKLDGLNGFLDKFLQLKWEDDENDIFSYDYTKSVKFIGEAGMGKTTQMKRMYYQLLSDVAGGTRTVIPVWIELKEVPESCSSLENLLEMYLGEYGHYCDLMIEKNVIALFLDGYNEILDENLRRIVANEVDTLHKEHPEILIAMTDRSKKSNPLCLQKNISTYTFNGLSRDEIEKYALLKCDADKKEDILAYLKKTDWIYSTNMIPEKMNNLIALLSDDIEPETEDEFYDTYLEYILDREADEKKETRIEDLKFCLGELTQIMKDPRDEKTRNEIIRLWLSLNKNDLHAAQDLFDLAIKLPILKPGTGNNTYKFVHEQYFMKCEEGF